MSVNTVHGVKGVEGRIYSTTNGPALIEDVAPYDEITYGVAPGTYGWKQITADTRVRVYRKQITHTACCWVDCT